MHVLLISTKFLTKLDVEFFGRNYYKSRGHHLFWLQADAIAVQTLKWTNQIPYKYRHIRRVRPFPVKLD